MFTEKSMLTNKPMSTKSHFFSGFFLFFCFFFFSADALAYKQEKRNPENLSEWIIEGSMEVRSGKQKQKAFFTWTQTDTHYKLELREDNMVGKVFAHAKGELWQQQNLKLSSENDFILNTFKQQDLYTPMAFWLRALPDDESSKITKEKDGQILEMKSADIANTQWNIELDDYLEFNNYPLPQKIKLESEHSQISIDVLRAETGFITSGFFNNNAMTKDCLTTTVNNTETAEASAADAFFKQYEQQQKKQETYKWINTQSFCEQLAKIHGGTIDPKQGLFGPDSMMWELNRYVMPAGFGAGRALLLQIAHPWVTAGIDEHSDVRNDPVERGRRTFVYMYTIIYGSLPQAMNAAYEVHQIHEQIKGHLPYDAAQFTMGSEYRANEIEAMIWVQATLWDTLVLTYEKIERKLTPAEKEQFYQETKLFAMMFGIPAEALPENWYEFERYNKYMWRRLEVTDAAKKLSDDLFNQKNPLLMVLMPIQKNFTKASLPPRIREQYNMEIGWFGETFYSGAVLGAKVGDRFLIPPLRYNPIYREAKARVEGKKSGVLIRSSLKSGVGKPVLVN